MQHHHIDPIDVRTPSYQPGQCAKPSRSSLSPRFRDFLLPILLIASLVSVAHVTLGVI